jgi:hypothetical protein
MGRPSSVIVSAGKAAFIAGTVLVVCYWVAFGWMVYMAPMPYRELDLNHDGQVSFGEVNYAASFGERAIQVNGQQCTEYFAYKDGLPLKVVCGSRG